VADVAFASSTVLAACAHSHGARDAGRDGGGAHSACLVDFLLPPARAVVGGLALPDGSGHCLVALRARAQVLVGGKRGELSLWDLRTHAVVHTWTAHAGAAVRAHALARDGQAVASGGSDGSLKLWDVRAVCAGANADSDGASLAERWASARHHEKHTMLQPLLGFGPGTTHGVTALAATSDCVYSCGADGRVLALQL
jgi:WD40 repeat protein